VELPPEVVRLGERTLDAARLERRRREVVAEVRLAGGEQPGLKRRLYPYQVEGVAFLHRRRCGAAREGAGAGPAESSGERSSVMDGPAACSSTSPRRSAGRRARTASRLYVSQA